MFWGSISMSSSLSSLSSLTSAMTLTSLITGYMTDNDSDHGSSSHYLITWGHPLPSPPPAMDGVTAHTRQELPDVSLGEGLFWSNIPIIEGLTQFQVICSTPPWTRWPVWGRGRWLRPSLAAWRASSPSSSPPPSRSSPSKPWRHSQSLRQRRQLSHFTMSSLRTIHILTRSNTNMWTITTISTATRPAKFIIRFVNGDLLRKVVR